LKTPEITVKSRCLVPVILCGGKGTRLWPISRESYPKQFWALTSENSTTLLQQTNNRLKAIRDLGQPIVICNEEHRFIVAEQMRQIKINPQSILLEPVARNTAPAIALAALEAIKDKSDPLLLCLAADHEINDTKKFVEAVEIGKKYADQGRLVTFGVIPEKAETGYGYIEASNQLDKKSLEGSKISRFIEKPCKEDAEKYILDKKFLWNSGIFIFKASTILQELKKHFPEIIYHCEAALNKKINDLDFSRINEESFSKCPNIPIDIAVMEKTDLGTVIPLNSGWSDIGSWNSLWDSSQKDQYGNYIKGKAISEKCTNCYIRSEHRLIAAIGLKNLIIVETDDAILVANKENSQDVKAITKKLNDENNKITKQHKKIYRPWGSYTGIDNGQYWQVKRIEVKPGGSLSLQLHKHRAEHWIVVKGNALIEINGKQELLLENQSTYIPLGSKHRLSNPGEQTIELIEVQTGNYLGEDDIIRFDDCYGRTI
tara:strand:- start:101 stop:1561 length:1461 start_codon:yes stop_codon:yes gene_type:complete